jgi:DNA-binding XRE family transcriptional regulator
MINNNDKTHRMLVKEFGRAKAKQLLIGAGFAAHLRASVNASSYTRQQLATAIGCSKPALDKWLNGSQYPAVHYLWRICVNIHPNQTILAYVGYTIKISLER